MAGCGGTSEDVPQAPADVYEVRGIVQRVDDSEVLIQHEAVPDFKGATGKVVGMDSMAMPFPAEAELLEGLSEGDKIDFTFEVRWDADGNPLQVTAATPLPADTVLDFERAEPTDAESEGEPGADESGADGDPSADHDSHTEDSHADHDPGNNGP